MILWSFVGAPFAAPLAASPCRPSCYGDCNGAPSSAEVIPIASGRGHGGDVGKNCVGENCEFHDDNIRLSESV